MCVFLCMHVCLCLCMFEIVRASGCVFQFVCTQWCLGVKGGWAIYVCIYVLERMYVFLYVFMIRSKYKHTQ